MSNSMATETLQNMCHNLILWENMTPFLRITTIDNISNYKQNLNEFEENLKIFYCIGIKYFFTKIYIKIGNDKKYYIHCLRFYMPMITKEYYKNTD